MYKKLLTLTLVLAICALAQAATYQWDGETGNRLWSDPVNWAGDIKPALADMARFTNAVGTINVYSNETLNRVQAQGPANAFIIKVRPGITLSNSGSFEMENMTAGNAMSLRIDAGAVVNAVDQSQGTGTANSFKIGRAATPRYGDAIVDVYGTLNCVSVDAVEKSEMGIGTWGAGGGAGGKGLLIIHGGGIATVDNLLINTNPLDGTFQVRIYETGKLVVGGLEEWATIAGYISSGNILANGFANKAQMNAVGGNIEITVPEPMTVALLGLGGLLLRRRR